MIGMICSSIKSISLTTLFWGVTIDTFISLISFFPHKLNPRGNIDYSEKQIWDSFRQGFIGYGSATLRLCVMVYRRKLVHQYRVCCLQFEVMGSSAVLDLKYRIKTPSPQCIMPFPDLRQPRLGVSPLNRESI